MIKKIVFAVLMLAAFASSAFAQTVPGDVIVIFKNPSENKISTASLASGGEHESYLASVASEMDARVTLTYDVLSENSNEIFAVVHSDTKTEQELLKEFLARPDVKGASLNYISYPASKTPNDKYYALQWGMKAISADEVWDVTTGSSNVYVAVIDSGIDATHPDLKANIATEYCKAWDKDGNVISDYSDLASMGHGTHVSGIIGAVGNNGEGVAGVNWNTKVIMYKPHVVTGIDNKGNEVRTFPDDLTILALQEIKRLKDNGLNIAALNMSLGGWENRGGTPDEVSNAKDPYWAAIKAVSDSGIIICVAAGNEGQAVGLPAPLTDEKGDQYDKGDYAYPASYLNIPNMIVVAAASQDVNGKIIRSTDGKGEADSNFSSTYVDIAAPGSHIVSTTPYNEKIAGLQVVEEGVKNYASWPGTSMATPYVAGTVALLKSAYPNATGKQIKRAIFKGADGNYCTKDSDDVVYSDDVTHVTKDNTCKYGFLNVKAAYDALPEIIKAEANATTKPATYNVSTEIDETSTSKILALNVGENEYGETPQKGDKFYVWLTKILADDDYYITYVKTAGQLDIDVDNLYKSDGVTKAYIEAGTYTVSYKSADGAISGGYDTPVELAATSKTSNNNSSSSGSGCLLSRNEEAGSRKYLLLALFMLGLMELALIKKSGVNKTGSRN